MYAFEVVFTAHSRANRAAITTITVPAASQAAAEAMVAALRLTYPAADFTTYATILNVEPEA